jgi:ADP-heptose:LPS heptosyltransferase
MKISKEKIKSILFITLSNLGDIILTTPVLQRLRDEFPAAKIDVITGAPGKEIFERHPSVREVIVQQKNRNFGERLKQLVGLRRNRYDLVVDLKNSLLPYFSGAKYRSALSVFSKGGIKHKRDEHLLKLAALGIDPFYNNSFFMPVSAEEREYVDSLIGPDWKRVVVLNPGAKSHLKRWDAAKYAQLADKIVSELKCRVLVTGNEDDVEAVSQVVSHVTTPVKDLCEQTSIGALAELIRRSDLVITNDSAPLHVASAVNATTIAIFGPSDEKRYGPLSDKSRVIKPDVPCRPCGKALCKKGPVEGCISNITVEEVLDTAKQVLS